MSSSIREMRAALRPGQPTILFPTPPYRDWPRTIGHLRSAAPGWTTGQREAWESARALHNEFMRVSGWTGVRPGARPRLPGVDEHWRRLDVATYLYVAWMALEALIAPLFAGELERTVCDDGTASTGE